MKGKERILIEFGKRLKKLRESKDMTQMDLAVEIESYPGYVSRLENGKAEPGLIILLGLAKALNCTPNELIDYTSL